VGTGNTEVYLREGPITLAVFTVNGSGTPVSSYFNILWEDRVVGRQTILPTATRTYYHTDILGSTRAVVLSTTGAVVESYDFEPWGLLMPGRTLGSGTKEGFSGKEQDAETGLDYFGARYYMPALGRWAAVDPMAERMPEWSSFAYDFDSPTSHTDPTGLQAMGIGAFWATHPEMVEGVKEGFVARAQRTLDLAQHPHQLLTGTALLMLAVSGNQVATDVVTQGVLADATATVDEWNSGERGKGRVLGGLAEAGVEIAVVAGAARVVEGAASLAQMEGIIYGRTTPRTGGFYVGRAKSEAAYLKRQAVHDARLGVRHEYKILQRTKAGVDLRVAEESHIRANGGPGRLQNKRFEMNDKAYTEAGGAVPKS
jgi:RHS repeat-associated protein